MVVTRYGEWSPFDAGPPYRKRIRSASAHHESHAHSRWKRRVAPVEDDDAAVDVEPEFAALRERREHAAEEVLVDGRVALGATLGPEHRLRQVADGGLAGPPFEDFEDTVRSVGRRRLAPGRVDHVGVP